MTSQQMKGKKSLTKTQHPFMIGGKKKKTSQQTKKRGNSQTIKKYLPKPCNKHCFNYYYIVKMFKHTQNQSDWHNELACTHHLEMTMIFYFFFFGHAMQHMGSQFPDQGSNPCLLQWKLRVLTNGPPGKSPEIRIIRCKLYS